MKPHGPWIGFPKLTKFNAVYFPVALLCLAILSGRAETVALEQGLLAYLPLRLDLLDHSAANHPVKASRGVELRDGGAYFDGRTNWLELPHLDFGNRPFSISMWVKTTGGNPMYGLIEQQDDNIPNRWLHIMLRGGRQPYLGFYLNDAISPRGIPLGQWSHLVFQYNGTRQEIWIDGRLLCARKTKAYEGTRGQTFIGKSPGWDNVPSKDFEGYLREIRLYGRALSVNEIVTLYRQDNGAPVNPALGVGEAATQPVVAGLSDALAAQVGIPFLAIDGRKLVITGEANQIYEVQVTSDLTAVWQPLVTLTNHTGVVEFTDANAQNIPQRFYRLKVQ